jgi:hypothetical protein
LNWKPRRAATNRYFEEMSVEGRSADGLRVPIIYAGWGETAEVIKRSR